MKNFSYYVPTRVLFGAGQLNALHAQSLPGKLVCDGRKKQPSNPTLPIVCITTKERIFDHLKKILPATSESYIWRAIG